MVGFVWVKNSINGLYWLVLILFNFFLGIKYLNRFLFFSERILIIAKVKGKLGVLWYS